MGVRSESDSEHRRAFRGTWRSYETSRNLRGGPVFWIAARLSALQLSVRVYCPRFMTDFPPPDGDRPPFLQISVLTFAIHSKKKNPKKISERSQGADCTGLQRTPMKENFLHGTPFHRGDDIPRFLQDRGKSERRVWVTRRCGVCRYSPAKFQKRNWESL